MSFKRTKTNFIVALAKLLMKLPLSFILALGYFVGWLFWLIPNKRKKIAHRNIELCFPDLSFKDRKKLLKQNLISNGKGLLETIYAYWGKTEKITERVEFSGLDVIEKALSEENGCLLISCHLHPMELVIRAINNTLSKPGHMLARQHNNKIFEEHVDIARRTHCKKTIDKKDMKNVLKSLKNNYPVYFFPDQNFSYQFEYINFFGVPAATVTGLARLAKSTNVPVIPWFGFRRKDSNGKTIYHVDVLPPLGIFQGDDIKENLLKLNQLFEQQIKKHPEHYLWVHRRFKNHPKGRNYLYKNL